MMKNGENTRLDIGLVVMVKWQVNGQRVLTLTLTLINLYYMERQRNQITERVTQEII